MLKVFTPQTAIRRPTIMNINPMGYRDHCDNRKLFQSVRVNRVMPSIDIIVKTHVYKNCHEFLLGGGHILYFGTSNVITRLPPSKISAIMVVMNANVFISISVHKK